MAVALTLRIELAQVLHVWSRSYRDSVLFEREYNALPEEMRASSVLLITRVAFGGEWIW
tara:strand:+ start:849 stop:1025 length:177 start_codon:yes stop_codon:yes gene_type:complete